MAPAPIVVMSFNRPDYLVPVLRSLSMQDGCQIERRAVYLFQDGHRNAFSFRAHGAPELLEQSIAAFRHIFPRGVVMAAPHNLGVALNFDRAERFVFEDLQAEAAIFLEDDMVLSRHYIAVIDHLLDTQLDNARVGYIGAYGEHTLPLVEQRREPHRLVTLHHNWAFALYRRQWLAMRPVMAEYLALVGDRDYRARDNAAITALYAKWGYGPASSSQDAAKTLACVMLKTIKIKTRVCYGRYIGARGLHFNPAVYEKRGYANTEFYPDRVTSFETVTDELYARVLAELTRWAGKPKPAA